MCRGTPGMASCPARTPDRELIDAHVATARIVHEFTNDIKITNTTRYVNVDRLNRATLPNNTTHVPQSRRTYRPGRQWTEFTNELWANNTDFAAKFNTGGLRHSVVAGVDITKEDRTQVSRTYTANGGPGPAPRTRTPTGSAGPSTLRAWRQSPTRRQLVLILPIRSKSRTGSSCSAACAMTISTPSPARQRSSASMTRCGAGGLAPYSNQRATAASM